MSTAAPPPDPAASGLRSGPVPNPGPGGDDGDDSELVVGRLLWDRMPRSGTMLIGAGRAGVLLTRAMLLDPPSAGGLSVVTDLLVVGEALAQLPQLTVYTLGGVVNHDGRPEGGWAIEHLDRLHIDAGLISPDGVDPGGGLTCDSVAGAAVAEAQVRAVDHLIALAEPATLGRTGLIRFADASQLAEIVIPPGLDTPTLGVLDAFAGLGVGLIRPGCDL